MRVRLAVACLLASCIAIGLPAQQVPWENEQIYERLDLTEQHMAAIQQIVRREDKTIREAQAELNVNRAQLEKLLLDAAPDMRQVERLLQLSLEWKLKSEMAGIRRRVEIRAIVGEDKWEELVRAWRAWRLRGERNADDRASRERRQRPAQPAPQPRR